MNSSQTATFTDQPWMRRKDWAEGRIKSSTMAQFKTLLIMATAFTGMGALISFHAIRDELPKRHYAVLLALLFPLAGLFLFGVCLNTWRARRRFGECFVELSQVPIPLGGVFEGVIQTGARVRMEHELVLRFSCIRRTVSGSGKNQNVQENILWQDEKVYSARAALPEPEPGHSAIPIHFKLPADQPECQSHGNETVFWRLEAKSKMRGPTFHVLFDVPVFAVANTAADVADDADPTVALQAPIEEIRRDEHSKIQISNGPGGREFYFPAARNLGVCIGLSVFFLAWTGFTIAGHWMFKALDFEIIFTLIDALVFVICLNLWLKSSRVTISPKGVTLANRWLIFGYTRQFTADEIVKFDAQIGMTSGQTAYQSLKLITRASETPRLGISGITLAGGVANKKEADWLVQEMTKALGRTTPPP
jgi:hypothetical protein